MFKSLAGIILSLHKRMPLTFKMVVITVIVAGGMWAVFDVVQTKSLKTILLSQLNERLAKQAMEDRLNFDRYVKAHLHSINLFISQNKFSEYIEKQNWDKRGRVEIEVYKRPPGWFPKSSVMRTFIHPRFAMLMDYRGNLREVYYGRQEEALPEFLIKPSEHLLLNSNGQNYVTNFKGKPYLVASERYIGPHGKAEAILMLVSPIDDIFLTKAIVSSSSIAALLTTEEHPRILTSSNLTEIPVNTPMEEIKKRYLVTGQEFFDYGSSEQPIKFASFISMEEVNALIKSIASSERQLRIAGLPVLIISFALLMFWVTKRIQLMTRRISDFSEKTLGVQPRELQKGDQLYALEESFQLLTEEVLEARDLIRKEAEEKLLLEKRDMEMKQKERQLELLQSVTEAVGVGVVKKTADGLVVVNKQMEEYVKICGGLSCFEIADERDVEIEIADINNQGRIFHINCPDIFEEEICLVRDITKIKEQTEALEYMAMHDALTNLPNRALLRDRLQHAIYLGKREGKPLALLMMDLDRFKEINDTLGHHVGDIMLKQVGQRLRKSMRQSDTLARLGGDEFAAVLPVINKEQAEEVAHKLLRSLEKPFDINEHNLYVGVSIGMVYFPEHGEDASTLLQRADVAMYVAKNAQSGLSIYNAENDEHSLQNLVRINELRRVIEEDGLSIHYHPKICFESGKVSGVEALARWNHPEHGYIPPEEFVPMAERAGLIKQMTKWVIDRSIQQYVEWYREGIDQNINLSINLSVKNLLDSNFPEEVEGLIEKWNVDPNRIEFEITESAVMADPKRAMEVLKKLDALGIRLSIDDFGTGYSSLAYLKELPVDEIKIDKSFVMNMTTDKSDAMIVHSIIDLAHNLCLSVIAEGVNTEETWQMLKKLGCDGAQGHHLCLPLTGKELVDWISYSECKL